MTNIIKGFIIIMIFSTNVHSYCFPAPCDPSIIYAMEKQRNTLRTRLNDLITAFKKNNEAIKNQTRLLTYETKAYSRIKERTRIEYITLENSLHFATKAKDSTDLAKSTEFKTIKGAKND